MSKKNVAFLVTLSFVTFSTISFVGKKPTPLSGTKIGNAFPLNVLKSEEGKALNLENFRGSMVLLEFWESTDARFRFEQPSRNEVLREFKSKRFVEGKGLNVVSVSLDDSRALYAEVSRRLSYPDEIMRLGAGEHFKVDPLLAHQAEIKNFLIDGHGMVVAKNLDVFALRNELSRFASN